MSITEARIEDLPKSVSLELEDNEEFPIATGYILDKTHLYVEYPSLPAGYDDEVEILQRHDVGWNAVGSIIASGSVTIDADRPKVFWCVATTKDGRNVIFPCLLLEGARPDTVS